MSNMATAPKRITLVTVTYGNRQHLLLEALSSAFNEGVDNAVVVSNGSRDPIAQTCLAHFPGRVHLVEHPVNLGSAPGFRAGLQAAHGMNVDFILLLDDDNRLELGSVQHLQKAYDCALKTSYDRPLAVVGFRPENQTEINAGKQRQRLHPNAFFGFHLKHVPSKIIKRLKSTSKDLSIEIPPIGILDFAPYSGMFFHRSLLDQVGFPNADFVLYADDTEFSYRINRMGGKLLVVTSALVSDIEPSWNIKRLHSSAFAAWLKGGSDLSVYYAARNRAFFESTKVPHGSLIRTLNRAIFLTILKVLASKNDRCDRYHLFKMAITDGEANRLGVKAGFELK